jgi:hypothetical protein
LFNRWTLLGGLAALLIACPYILWQVPRGWPTVEFLVAIKRQVANQFSSLNFLIVQILFLHPLNFPIWLAGLGWFLTAKDARPFRVFGWAYLFILSFLLVTKSKNYYLAPAYPFLLAGGAVAIEGWVNQRGLRRLKLVLPAVLVSGGLAFAPAVLPLLPINKTDAYITAITAGLLKDAGAGAGGGDFAYVFHAERGWENQAKVVAEVFHRLRPEEQANCIIFAGNYGGAGAIDFYGHALELPSATSIHQNYYFWGPPAKPAMAIAFGVRRDWLQQYWGHIQQAATIRSPEAMRQEQNVPVYVCRKPLVSLKDAWPALRARAFVN